MHYYTWFEREIELTKEWAKEYRTLINGEINTRPGMTLPATANSALTELLYREFLKEHFKYLWVRKDIGLVTQVSNVKKLPGWSATWELVTGD